MCRIRLHRRGCSTTHRTREPRVLQEGTCKYAAAIQQANLIDKNINKVELFFVMTAEQETQMIKLDVRGLAVRLLVQVTQAN
jgi:hypothetical protein